MSVADESCAQGVSRAELRKRKLLETARKLFVDNGFHSTGVAQIAKESGIAVAQIYRDFGSKEGIVAALVQTDCADFLQRDGLEAAIRAGDDATVLDWLLDLLEVDDDLAESRMFAEIVAESSRNPRIAAIFVKLQRELKEAVVAALSRLSPGPGARASLHDLADVIMTMSLGLLQRRLMLPAMEQATVVAALKELVVERLDRLRSPEPPSSPM